MKRIIDGKTYNTETATCIAMMPEDPYNTIRPHGALGCRPPAPEVFVPAFTAWPAALTRPAPPAKLPVVQRPTLH